MCTFIIFIRLIKKLYTTTVVKIGISSKCRCAQFLASEMCIMHERQRKYTDVHIYCYLACLVIKWCYQLESRALVTHFFVKNISILKTYTTEHAFSYQHLLHDYYLKFSVPTRSGYSASGDLFRSYFLCPFS